MESGLNGKEPGLEKETKGVVTKMRLEPSPEELKNAGILCYCRRKFDPMLASLIRYPFLHWKAFPQGVRLGLGLVVN